MKHYTELNNENYLSFFKDYMSEKEKYLDYLKDVLMAQGLGEEVFDFSPQSLLAIWQKLQSLVVWSSPIPDFEKNLDNLPIWVLLKHLGFCSVAQNAGYSEETIRVLNGLGYYIGDVLVKNHGAVWEPAFELDASIVGAFVPVIRLRPRNIWKFAVVRPFNIPTSAALNVWLYKEDLSDSNVFDYYNSQVEQFINSEPPPPPESEFKEQYPKLAKKLSDFGIYELDELVEINLLSKDNRVTMDGIDCNKRFITSSALEMIIGDKNFRHIVAILMSIEGIQFVAQEDREVFYLKSTMGKKKLQAAILNKIEISMI